MGLSSNQARFLSLTARQVDLEQRVQQICQRRLRLASELERVATEYNNSISNRKMFTMSTNAGKHNELSISNLNSLGYDIIVSGTDKFLGESILKKGVETVTSPKFAGQVEIHNSAEFINLINSMNSGDASALDGNYILMGDIDLSSLGTLNSSLIKNTFTGSLDGNGYQISGLNINESSIKNSGTSTKIGFFSTLAGDATITNLVLKDFNITSTASNNPNDQTTARVNNAGALAGYVNSTGVVIDNITVLNANINAQGCATGGLIGVMNEGSVTNCQTDGTVTGGNYIGGLIGRITGTNGVVDICNSSANVISSANYAGGLIGEAFGGSPITRSYATGNVTASGHTIGGLVGRCLQILQDCYATGNVSGTTIIGGLVGDYNKPISNSYATGNATGTSLVGALTGNDIDPSETLTNCFWEGAANGSTAQGYNNTHGSTVTNCHYVANNAALVTAAKAANWGNTVYPETEMTGNGGSWDTNTTPPTLYAPTGNTLVYTPEQIEEGIRNGRYSLLKKADKYTQSSIELGNESYEMLDWRTLPEISDELYNADDADAESKYDTTVANINSQDKKLQLEQSSVEVEYKAVASEKEAVKKILDTNAANSFKYFG